MLFLYVCTSPLSVYVCMFVFHPCCMYVCIDWLVHGRTHWEPCGYQSFPHEFKELKVPQIVCNHNYTTTTTVHYRSKDNLYTESPLKQHSTGQYNTCVLQWSSLTQHQQYILQKYSWLSDTNIIHHFIINIYSYICMLYHFTFMIFLIFSSRPRRNSNSQNENLILLRGGENRRVVAEAAWVLKIVNKFIRVENQ